MNREDVFNFSAGPSVLPTEVLQTAAAELLNYHGSGLSVMEMSHRSREFMDIFAATKAKLKKALSVPDTHEILFLQGGASLQFSMIPLNLTAEGDTADYAVTGNFANIAAKEAGKYCRVNIAASSEATGFDRIPAQEELSLSPEAKYFYYCANNTIFGTAWKYVPETGGVPIVCDMSSEILSHPVDVSKFGIVYAGAQKNMAPAGLTVVIIDRRARRARARRYAADDELSAHDRQGLHVQYAPVLQYLCARSCARLAREAGRRCGHGKAQERQGEAPL